jgi:hypothetical protein
MWSAEFYHCLHLASNDTSTASVTDLVFYFLFCAGKGAKLVFVNFYPKWRKTVHATFVSHPENLPQKCDS